MLDKQHLAAAIREAVKLKIEKGIAASKAEIARHFGVAPSSLAEWEKFGTIQKTRIGDLVSYFSDVVQVEHWDIGADEAVFWLSANKKAAPTKAHHRQLVSDVCDIAKKIDDHGLKELIVFAECLAKSRPFKPKAAPAKKAA
jgi:hypothetical protein